MTLTEARSRMNPRSVLIWTAVAIVGAVAWAILALSRGENVSAIWMVVAALGSYAIAYRFYARFIVKKVLRADDSRATPAERLDNGTDFQPMDRRVLFGHHFAAIAGAGPLVGPVLAAQMGYLPGTIWIIVGVIFAGAVQDMVTLFFSMRRDGRSLGQMARDEIGVFGGVAALIAVFAIMIILLAVLALIVVNALAHSPWGTFSIAMTIPIALFMGFYLRFLRPGRVMEVTGIGVVPDATSEWKPESAPHAIVMNTNGKSDPANTGPVPLKANSVNAAVWSVGAVKITPSASSAIVPIFMNVDR